MPKGSILVVDDEAEIREGLELLLDVGRLQRGDRRKPATAALARLEEQPFDLLLLDVSLPDRNGLELLREIRQRDPSLPVVLITAYGSIDMARAAFKSGAQDYITKPWSNDELLAQVALAVEGRRLREENVQLKRALKERYNFPNIIGKSEKHPCGARPGHAGGAIALDRADHRRKRHRQGTDRQGHSFRFDARRQAVCARQQRLDPRGPARIAAVRPRQGRLHQRGGLEKGPLRGRRSGHDFLRRNLHHQPGNAGQAAARDPGARIHAPGRHGNDQGGRAHPGGLQRRPAPAGPRRALPRRPLPPA